MRSNSGRPAARQFSEERRGLCHYLTSALVGIFPDTSLGELPSEQDADDADYAENTDNTQKNVRVIRDLRVVRVPFSWAVAPYSAWALACASPETFVNRLASWYHVA